MKEKIFKNFLIANKCYKKWKYNVKCYNYFNPQKNVRYYFNTLSPDTLINSAFVWENSPQGHDYWYEIHLKWIRYYEQHRKAFSS